MGDSQHRLPLYQPFSRDIHRGVAVGKRRPVEGEILHGGRRIRDGMWVRELVRLSTQLLISRITGQLATNTHLSGSRVNQELTRSRAHASPTRVGCGVTQ